MKSFAAAFTTIAAFASTLPAAAQDTEIVVEGETPAEPANVRDLVQKMATTQRTDQPATRYFDTLCVSVSGLNPAGNAYVRERIYENAEQIGLGNQGEDCLANAMVLIHDDPAALVTRIISEAPQLLPTGKRDGVRKQLEDGSQIIVWHNERDYNQGGRPGVINSAIPGDGNVGGSMNVETQVNVNNWPSRTKLAFSRAVVSAAIILDAEIVGGMEIDRLADYATMRLMAPQLVPERETAPVPASVISPFPQATESPVLTRFDWAYLTALYSMRPNAPGIRLAERVAAAYAGSD